MAHDHAHGDRNAYYLDQLFTIAVCGALGGVAIMLWYTGKLSLMLAPKFFIWTLLGGITLLVLVLIRAVSVWRSVDEAVTVPEHTHDHEHCGHDHGHCDHEHEHGIRSESEATGFSAADPRAIAEEMHKPLFVDELDRAPPVVPLEKSVPAHHHHHDHDHGHSHAHAHGHDHGHDHGWAPWRYVVLLFPVVLYFLNLPNQRLSADAGDTYGRLNLDAPTSVRSTGTTEIGFAQLQQASLTPESRDYYEGKTIALTGKYSSSNEKRFTLVRYKIACCAADAVPLNAVIMLDPNSTEKIDQDIYRNNWVEVTGRIHFFQKPGSNEYVTALMLYPSKEEPLSQLVKSIPPPASPYLN